MCTHVCVYIHTQAKLEWAGKYLKELQIVQWAKEASAPFPWVPTASPALPKTMAGSQSKRKGWGEANQAGRPLIHSGSTETQGFKSFS